MDNDMIMLSLLVIMPLCGIGAILFGLWMYRRDKRLLQTGLVAEARVVGFFSRRDTIAPIFEYETPEGTIRVKHRVSVSPILNKYKVGNVVRVIYNAEKPRHFLVEGSKSYFMGFIAVALGVFTFAAGFLVYFLIE